MLIRFCVLMGVLGRISGYFRCPWQYGILFITFKTEELLERITLAPKGRISGWQGMFLGFVEVELNW